LSVLFISMMHDQANIR